jgi:hypothetical protein
VWKKLSLEREKAYPSSKKKHPARGTGGIRLEKIIPEK